MITQIASPIPPTPAGKPDSERSTFAPTAAQQFVKAWLADLCADPANSGEALQTLHESFTAWCNEQDIRALSLGVFYRVMLQLGFRPTQVKTEQGVRRAFKGIGSRYEIRKATEMKTMELLDRLEFHNEHPYAQPLLVTETGRVLRFMLKPGQHIEEHNVPGSPFFIVVLKGEGIFVGNDGNEQRLGPNSLLIFDPGERHSVRALDEELIFVGFLHGVPDMRSGRVSGAISRREIG